MINATINVSHISRGVLIMNKYLILEKDYEGNVFIIDESSDKKEGREKIQKMKSKVEDVELFLVEILSHEKI